MANIRIATPSRVKMDTAGKNFLDSYQAGLAGFQALSQSAEKHESDMESAEQDRATARAENDRRNRELRLKEREEKRQSMLFDAGVSTAAAQVTGWDDQGTPPSWLSSGTRALWDQAQGLYETIADKRERGEDVTADVLAFKGIVDQYEQQVPGDRRRQAFSSKAASLTELYEKANEAPNPEIMGLISQGLEAGKFNMGFDPTVEDLAKLGAEHARLTKRVAEIGQIGQVAVQLGAQREFVQSLLAGTLTDENGQPIENLPQGEDFLEALKEGGLYFELKQMLDEDYDPWDPENSLQDSTRRLGIIRGKLGIMRGGPDSVRDYDYKALMLRKTQEEVAMFKDRQQVAAAYLAEAMERAAAGKPLSPEHQFALLHMDASAQDKGIMYDITYDDDEAYGNSWSLIKERRAAHPGGLPGAAADWDKGAAMRSEFQSIDPKYRARASSKQRDDAAYWKSFAQDFQGWVLQGTDPVYSSGMADVDAIINANPGIEINIGNPLGYERTGPVQEFSLLRQAIEEAGFTVDEFFGRGRHFDPEKVGLVRRALGEGVSMLGTVAGREGSGVRDDFQRIGSEIILGGETVTLTYNNLQEVAIGDPEMFAEVMRFVRYDKAPRTRAEVEAEREQERLLSEAEQRGPDREPAAGQPGVSLADEAQAELAARGMGSRATDYEGAPPVSMEEAMGEAPRSMSDDYAAEGDDARRLQQLTDQDRTQPDLGLGDEPAGYSGSGVGYPEEQPVAPMDDPGNPMGVGNALNPGIPLTDEEILANEVPPELEPVPDAGMLGDVYQGGQQGGYFATPRGKRERKFARSQPIYESFKKKYRSFRRSDILRVLRKLDSNRADDFTDDMRVAYVAAMERLEELDRRRDARKRSR